VAAYPAHREADVALRDGSTIHIRPVRADDEEAVLAFYRGLSERSLWFRFFGGGPNLEKAARWAIDVDYESRYGLVATTGIDHEVVGHGSYSRIDEEHAEVAFAIADQVQGHGLGTILLAHLAEVADANGISIFHAEVLPENHAMADVFRESGFAVKTSTKPGVVVFEFPAALSEDAVERFERREQSAAVAAMQTFLSPRSVAVIGATNRRGSIGGEIFHNLVSTSFAGPVYPVNPTSEVVQSVLAYPSITAIPGAVDLAVVVVPAASVLDVARECAVKGARAMVVISSGFGETGDIGLDNQRELLKICRDAGMRLIGPNCMGIINTHPDVRLNATFGPIYPPHGGVGFLSQSGALGLAVIDYAKDLGLGLSSFVSVGNKADISGNDLIHYWESDPDTNLILLYLESFGNPRAFARIARRVGHSKPIVAVKSGRSSAGARAASSHTGALLAASDLTVEALFRQAGVIRTDTLAEMFDVAALLANQPPPKGGRIGIVTNAGGPGILCADACDASGLEVPALPERIQRRLMEFLPTDAATANPVDMLAAAPGEHYQRAIDIVARSGAVDAIVAIFVPPLVTRPEDAAAAIRAAAAAMPPDIPLLTVFMSAHGVPEDLRGDAVRVPSYAFPEDAASALARAVQYGAWRNKPEGRIPSFPEARRSEAAALIATALQDGPRWLRPEEVAQLLSCYGLPLAEWRLAADPATAGQAAAEMGGLVALKAVAPTLLHKSESGAVALSLSGERQVAAAATEMQKRVAASGHRVSGFLVQQMAPAGVEMLVGVVHNPLFGPVVACGAGGTAVELMKDIAVRITPISDRDATELTRSLATFPLLTGYRGSPPTDVAALEDVILRVGALVEDQPQIAEMDCNPVIVHPAGAMIVDARIRVEESAPRAPLVARRRL